MKRLDLRHVLCPLDFSSLSKRALTHASAAAHARNAELRVLHVTGGASLEVPPGVSSVRHERLMLKLRQWLGESSTANQSIGAALRHGDPATQILKFARALPADLIVMAAAGAARPDRPVGPVASVVAARSECPVLIVPARRTRSATALDTGLFRRIVCAVDIAPSSTSVIRQAISLAWETGGLVTCICVVPERASVSVPRVRQRLLTAIQSQACRGCEVEGIVTTGVAGTEIVRFADQSQADVVVIGPPRQWTSTTHAVLSTSLCPVMVTHDLRPMRRPGAAGDRTATFSRR